MSDTEINFSEIEPLGSMTGGDANSTRWFNRLVTASHDVLGPERLMDLFILGSF